MSRTYKDQKKNKNKHRYVKEPQLTTRFTDVKVHGFESDFDVDECPDCGGVCEYRLGFFTCNECGWGDFSGKDKDDFFGEVYFAEAA